VKAFTTPSLSGVDVDSFRLTQSGGTAVLIQKTSGGHEGLFAIVDPFFIPDWQWPLFDFLGKMALPSFQIAKSIFHYANSSSPCR
jgi:hypothetical protein